MKTYFGFFKAGANYLVLFIVLVLFVLAEVCMCVHADAIIHTQIQPAMPQASHFKTLYHIIFLQTGVVASDSWLSEW